MAADGPRDDVSAGGEASVGCRVQVLLVVAVRGINIALANCDGSGVDSCGIHILTARHARGVGSLNKYRTGRAQIGSRCSYCRCLNTKWHCASSIALINSAIDNIDVGCTCINASLASSRNH